jgi:hypothetical protein
MNRTIIKLTLCAIPAMHPGNDLCAQRPPDSLFQKVVIFKRPVYGDAVNSAMRVYYRDAKLPQATGFYIRPDTAGQLYIATAKHVFLRNDSIQTITIQWKALLEKYSFWFFHSYRVRDVGLYPQDTLIDIVLANESYPPEAAGFGKNKVDGFHPSEIMTKEEFLAVKPGQELFYIGMNPDSISSEGMYYWFPTGKLKEICIIPKKVQDAMINYTFSYDFKIEIVGKPGISGSPIIMKAGDGYKVFGIINGHLDDTSQGAQTKNFIGTAGYRILDILRNHSLY